MYSAVMGWIVSLRTTLRISADAGAHSKTATATHCKIRGIVTFVIVWDPGDEIAKPSRAAPYRILLLLFANFDLRASILNGG